MKRRTQNNKWSISPDGEDFNYGDFFETKEEAIVSFRKDLSSGGYDKVKEQGFFWVGQCREHSISEFLNAEDVIENAWQMASDNNGEYAEDYLSDVSKEATKELDDLLIAWAEKHDLYPNFYQIINSEKVIL